MFRDKHACWGMEAMGSAEEGLSPGTGPETTPSRHPPQATLRQASKTPSSLPLGPPSTQLSPDEPDLGGPGVEAEVRGKGQS